MASFTTPRSWVAGEFEDETVMNTHIRDNMISLRASAVGGQQYAEVNSDVSVTATTEATADTVVTAPAVTFNGSTKLEIEFFAPYVLTFTGQTLTVVLYDGSSSIGKLGLFLNTGAYVSSGNVLKRVLTPSAASHTYSIRAYTDSGNASVGGGAGGSGAQVPAYILLRY